MHASQVTVTPTDSVCQSVRLWHLDNHDDRPRRGREGEDGGRGGTASAPLIMVIVKPLELNADNQAQHGQHA